MRNYLPLAAFAALCLLCSSLSAQLQSVSNWSAHLESSKAFVENKGQFNNRYQALGDKILFGFEDGATFFYFTQNGWGYRLDSLYKNPNRKKADNSKPKWILKTDLVAVNWIGSNANVQLLAAGKFGHTNTYATKGENGVVSAIEGVPGYKKLTYSGIYNGVDLIYTMHPNRGVEYRLEIAPNVSVGNIKMQYPADNQIKVDVNGDLLISTLFGNTRESKPNAFYADTQEPIEVRYFVEGNVVRFKLGAYDKTRSIVIDPWVQTPTLANSNGVWECESDAAGNVYIIGGDAPMKLQKYNSAGTLQWTYNTPWDTTNGAWLGALATNAGGDCFVSNGASPAAIQRISTAGSLTWSRNGGPFDEFWTIVFNCDQSKMIVGGTNTGAFPPGTATGRIFDISTSNGNINGSIVTTTTKQGIASPLIDDLNEVRAISSSRNAKYYFLTLDTIGAISQDFNLCPSNQGPLFKTNSSYNFSYKCEDYKPNGNSGICAIRANDKYVYTQNGSTISKRNLSSGAIINTAPIPGGVYTISFGFGQVGNSGIAIDSCGNVYVGSSDRVVKFDENLNIITSVTVPFKVYDVVISTGGDIIVCGASGNPANPQVGYVQSINMSACVPFALVCCNPTICPAGPICDIASPITLTSATAGGVWSGPGITNASTGVFSPSVAGAGTHKIVYTLPCGADSIFITVNACANLTVCRETNGDYTVSGGVGPYTWQSGVPFQNCSGCPLGNCIPFICAGFADTTWTTYSTATTATPPGTFPIRVTDANGNRIKLTSAVGIQPCANCPNYTTTVTSQTNIDCVNTTGSATVSSSGGTAPYTYSWNPGNLSGASQSGLAAGTYTVIATDNASCRDTITLTITSSGTPPSVTATATPTTCGLNNGTATAIGTGVPPLTYQWLPIGTIAQTITNLAPGDYVVIVTDGSGCSAAGGDTVTVAASSGFTTSVTTTDAVCTASNGTATATNSGGTGPFTYVWSPSGGSSATASNLAPGTYTVVVTDASGCRDTVGGTVGQSSGTLALNLTNPINPTCAGNDGSITVGLSGGTAPYTVTIDTGGTPIVVNIPFAVSQTVNNLPDGTVTVTVVDAQGCQVINSATLTAPNCCTFTVSANLTQPTCGQANGEIIITPSNGSGNYSYTWGVGVGAGNSATNIVAGNYNVTITDNGFANCFIDTTFVLNSNSSLALNLTDPTGPTCAGNDGYVTVGIIGGTAPYTVTIDTGSSTPLVLNVPAAIYQTVNGLPAATINVTVVDAQGCQVNSSVTLTGPANCCTFTVSASLTQPGCGQNNGQIVLNTANGSGNHTYTWANGAGSGNTASNLLAGSYDVTITDDAYANCFIDTTFSLVNPNAPTIALQNQANVPCAGDSSGSITISINGGTAPNTIAWSTGDSTLTVNNLTVGSYSVTVTDANNCAANDSYTITGASAVLLQMAATPIDCNDPNSGSASVVASGGATPYTYSWSNAATSATLNSVTVGWYTVTVTDANGCIGIDSVEVTGDNVSAFNLGPNLNICLGDTVILGTGLVGTVWSTGDTSDYLVVTNGGTYYGTITSGACSNSDTVTIFLEQEPNVPQLNVNDTIVCDSESLILRVDDEGYLYVWSTGDTSEQIVVDTPGIYIVTAINHCGQVSAEAFVSDSNCACRLYLPNAFSPNGDGANDVLKVYTQCTEIEEFSFSIFDRWGGLVYRSRDFREVWDGTSKGKNCIPGVYVYSISYLSRENGVRQIQRMKGSVTLLR